MLGKATARDVRIAAITAATLAVLTLAVGSVTLETMENVQTADSPRWILGRATGLTAYVLLLLLSVVGLLLAHPHRGRWTRPSALTRIRVHVSLAMFTLTFLVSHIVVLATDSYADVGFVGAVVPFAAAYRPVAVTLGVLAMWSGLVSGLTAGLAGTRPLVNVWWPAHKVALAAFVLTWLHALFAGSDTGQLRGFYGLSGFAVLALAFWRYATPTKMAQVHAVAHRATPHRPHAQADR
jgi:hypothetical protein